MPKLLPSPAPHCFCLTPIVGGTVAPQHFVPCVGPVVLRHEERAAEVLAVAVDGRAARASVTEGGGLAETT